jgi:hypothetical protein
MKWNTESMRNLLENGLPQYQIVVEEDPAESINTNRICVRIPDLGLEIHVYGHRDGSGRTEDGGYDGSHHGTKDICDINTLFVNHDDFAGLHHATPAALRVAADVLQFLESQEEFNDKIVTCGSYEYYMDDVDEYEDEDEYNCAYSRISNRNGAV